MPSRRTVLLVVVVLAVVVAGCSGSQPDSGAGAPEHGGGGDGGDGDRAAGDGDGGDGGGNGEADRRAFKAQNRAIIRTATVEMAVETFGTAREELVGVARERGGWIASSSETTHGEGNRTWKSGRLVLRVPSEEFQGAFEDVKAAGEVERANQDSEDVTDRLVDMEARLENLRTQRGRLRGLYEEANDTQAVLRIEERLSEVQGEIERLEAKKRNLEGRVAYSTITVEFHEPEPDPTPTPTPTPGAAYHEVGLVSAFLSSVNGVVVAVRAIAVTVAYALPYAVVFGLPLAGLAYLSHRRLL